MSAHPMVTGMVEMAERHTGPFKRDIEKIARDAKNVDAVRLARNPSETEAAHTLRFAKAAREHNKRVTDDLNRIVIRHAEGRAAHDRRIADKANLKPDPKWEQLTVTAFMSLPAKDKMPRLAELSKEGRGPEFAAILDAPRSVTGLSAEQIAAFRNDFIQQHAKAELEERDALDESLEAFLAAAAASARFVKELNDPGVIAAIERDESKARAAEVALAAGADAE